MSTRKKKPTPKKSVRRTEKLIEINDVPMATLPTRLWRKGPLTPPTAYWKVGV